MPHGLKSTNLLGMHDSAVLRHLAEAERHVKAGAKIVADQRQLVARLARAGHHVAEHKNWLALFENVQSRFVEHRAGILRELKM